MKTAYALRGRLHPKRHARSRPWNVYLNLVPDLLVNALAVSSEGELNQREVLPSFASKRSCTQV